MSPLDEFQYWAEMSERGKSKESKERAKFFYSEFKHLIEPYRRLDTCPINEIVEIVEVTQDCYAFIWEQDEFDPPYSQDRMTNLFEITGMTILKALLSKLERIQPFKGDYGEVKEALKHAMIVCERWIECCHNLTGRIWRKQKNHWEGDRFSPVSIIGYHKRLSEVKTKRIQEDFMAIIRIELF